MSEYQCAYMRNRLDEQAEAERWASLTEAERQAEEKEKRRLAAEEEAAAEERRLQQEEDDEW